MSELRTERGADFGPEPDGAAPADPIATRDASPESPHDAFHLGAIDVSADRPSHGLSSDRGTRWLVSGLVGGSLALAGVITLVRGKDDAGTAKARVELRAPLREALSGSLRVLASVPAAAADASPAPDAAARPRAATTASRAEGTPAATTSRGSARAGAPRPSDRDGASPTRGATPTLELPPPPEEVATSREPTPATEPTPVEPPVEPPPGVDAPEPADEAEAAPSGV